MRELRGESVNCDEVRAAITRERAFTTAELAHVDGCDACLDLWLDATVMQSLDAKPEVQASADFAARVVARLAEKRGAMRELRMRTPVYERYWGLTTAVLLVAAGLIAMAVADPMGLNTRMGAVFAALVVSEIGAIGLWLGTGRAGGRRR
jgi:hypothetical protein